MEQAKPRLIVVGPIPPPVHGVTVSTALVLKNTLLQEEFRLEHLDTSDHRSGANIGAWDRTNIALAARHVVELFRRTRREAGLVYLPLSQSTAGFLRDSLFILVAGRTGWKVSIHLRGGEFPGFYAARGRLMRWWIRSTLRRVTAAAVMGENLRSQFHDLVDRDRVAVVRNGTPDIGPGEGGAGKVVLFLSNLRRRKGVLVALDAAEEALQAEPSARFLFVGALDDPDVVRVIEERAQAYNGSIEFRPPVGDDDKRRLLRSASILLFPPSEPEGHPRVVLEAISAGLPVVTTNQGAIAETVVDGQTGFVLDDPTPHELAERILLLLRDAELRERMGAAARARYLEAFTQERADKALADWLGATARMG